MLRMCQINSVRFEADRRPGESYGRWKWKRRMASPAPSASSFSPPPLPLHPFTE